jgi:ferrochelatase
MHKPKQTTASSASTQKIAVLITNLGTPAAPTKKALRRYLKQFLSDTRVVEIPKLIWWPILNGIILNTRPAKSAKLYASIWTEQGSPLLVYTLAQRDALTEKLQQHGQQLRVACAMRYGEPSIPSVLNELAAQGVEKILVLPLYPQYSSAATGSTYDAISAQLTTSRRVPALRFIDNYHDNPAYITACANQINQYWQQHGRAEKLILSFHGLPKVSADKGDPYYQQCLATTRLIAKELGLADSQYLPTFQSRFGKAEWLQPYTDKTLAELAAQGINSVDVFCPGFAADCLETLEEIQVENKQVFLTAGGQSYNYIAALNAGAEHIDALTSIVEPAIADWLSAE